MPAQDFFLIVQKRHVIDIFFSGVEPEDFLAGVVFTQKMRNVHFQDFRRGLKLFFDQVFDLILDVGAVDRGKNEKDDDDPEKRSEEE
jgi:hypothetical protein